MSASISLQPDVLFHERYRVVRCIERGGKGAVFEVVVDERTATHRALKVMLPEAVEDDDLRARFEREARVTGVVQSDHVVRGSDAGVDEVTDTPFLRWASLVAGNWSTAMLVGGGVALAGGVVLYVTAPSPAVPVASASVGLGLRGVVVRGAF